MKASVSVMFEGSRMAALLHPEARESKEKVGPRCVSEALFLETLQTKIKPIELAARWACFVSDEMDQTWKF